MLFLCSLLHFVSLAPAGDRLGRTYVQFPAFVTSGTLEKRGARSIKPRRSGTTLKWTAATNASLRPSRRRPEYRHLVIVGFDERNVRSRCEETRCLLAEICHRMNWTAPGTRRNAVSPGQMDSVKDCRTGMTLEQAERPAAGGKSQRASVSDAVNCRIEDGQRQEKGRQGKCSVTHSAAGARSPTDIKQLRSSSAIPATWSPSAAAALAAPAFKRGKAAAENTRRAYGSRTLAPPPDICPQTPAPGKLYNIVHI